MTEGLGDDVLAVVEALDALRGRGTIRLSNPTAEEVQSLKVIMKLADAAPELVGEIRRLKAEVAALKLEAGHA